VEWKTWQSVSFSDRHLLPTCSGVYVIVDNIQIVWYVGQAINLQSRWLGRNHHRYPQLIRTHRKRQYQIYWQAFPAHRLDEQERLYIDRFHPELNGCKVKTYLPKQPQVEREIKRLFKAINRTTLLFPVIRSVVAGEYVDEDGIRSLVTLTTTNDFFLLAKSARKRYSAEVRKAWTSFETYCGKPEALYHAQRISAFNFNQQRFEFVEASEIIRHLSETPSAYERVVSTVELFGGAVATLKELSIIDELSLVEEYTFLREGKKTLKDVAYLNYRRKELIPFQ
jgi:hypothetical protein